VLLPPGAKEHGQRIRLCVGWEMIIRNKAQSFLLSVVVGFSSLHALADTPLQISQKNCADLNNNHHFPMSGTGQDEKVVGWVLKQYFALDINDINLEKLKEASSAIEHCVNYMRTKPVSISESWDVFYMFLNIVKERSKKEEQAQEQKDWQPIVAKLTEGLPKCDEEINSLKDTIQSSPDGQKEGIKILEIITLTKQYWVTSYAQRTSRLFLS
jgi:hypothetical protein